MAPLPGPVRIGRGLEKTRELLVLRDDRAQEVADRLATGEAGAAIALLVEVGEDGRVLVEEPPDPEPVDVDDDVAQVRQRLPRRPLPARGATSNRPGGAVSTARRTTPADDRIRSISARCSGVMGLDHSSASRALREIDPRRDSGSTVDSRSTGPACSRRRSLATVSPEAENALQRFRDHAQKITLQQPRPEIRMPSRAHTESRLPGAGPAPGLAAPRISQCPRNASHPPLAMYLLGALLSVEPGIEHPAQHPRDVPHPVAEPPPPREVCASRRDIRSESPGIRVPAPAGAPAPSHACERWLPRARREC